MLVVMQALAWLKRWWKVLLLPLGVIIWLVGRAMGKKVQIVSPELTQHAGRRAEIERETQVKLKAAGEKRLAEASHINQNYDAVIKNLDDAEARRAEALRADPDELNRFLKETGKSVRTPKT